VFGAVCWFCEKNIFEIFSIIRRLLFLQQPKKFTQKRKLFLGKLIFVTMLLGLLIEEHTAPLSRKGL